VSVLLIRKRTARRDLGEFPQWPSAWMRSKPASSPRLLFLSNFCFERGGEWRKRTGMGFARKFCVVTHRHNKGFEKERGFVLMGERSEEKTNTST